MSSVVRRRVKVSLCRAMIVGAVSRVLIAVSLHGGVDEFAQEEVAETTNESMDKGGVRGETRRRRRSSLAAQGRPAPVANLVVRTLTRHMVGLAAMQAAIIFKRKAGNASLPERIRHLTDCSWNQTQTDRGAAVAGVPASGAGQGDLKLNSGVCERTVGVARSIDRVSFAGNVGAAQTTQPADNRAAIQFSS